MNNNLQADLANSSNNYGGFLQDSMANYSAISGISANNPLIPSQNDLQYQNNPYSWSFVGFADGSVAMFDDRVATHGGRVNYSKDHKAWVVSCHLRADVPEVITGTLSGTIKFWDVRSLRAFKTIEVHKSPLTAMTVHNYAPIIATGSHAQFIKVLTMNGEQLSMIRYHDGFLGQRIGPISCLAFHPVKMMLAAGATDNIVSIYSTGDV
jgi:regulator-associated protein of mTOR